MTEGRQNILNGTVSSIAQIESDFNVFINKICFITIIPKYLQVRHIYKVILHILIFRLCRGLLKYFPNIGTLPHFKVLFIRSEYHLPPLW
jgi:hypothetical protein